MEPPTTNESLYDIYTKTIVISRYTNIINAIYNVVTKAQHCKTLAKILPLGNNINKIYDLLIPKNKYSL